MANIFILSDYLKTFGQKKYLNVDGLSSNCFGPSL